MCPSLSFVINEVSSLLHRAVLRVDRTFVHSATQYLMKEHSDLFVTVVIMHKKLAAIIKRT
jgi:hypothetical protein